MLGLSLGREYRDRISAALAAAVQYFLGCTTPWYAFNIREWDNTEEVTSIPSSSTSSEFYISTPTGVVSIQVSPYNSVLSDGQAISIETGDFHGREGVLKVTVPSSWFYQSSQITISTPLEYYNGSYVEYDTYANSDYTWQMGTSVLLSRDSNPLYEGIMGFGGGPAGWLQDDNNVEVGQMTADEWKDVSISQTAFNPNNTGVSRVGIQVPNPVDEPYGPSGSADPNYQVPGFEFYIDKLQLSICPPDAGSPTLSDEQTEVSDEGADYFSGTGYSFAKTSGAIFTPSYPSPHTWIPGEVGYQAVKCYGFTLAQWGAGTSNPPSTYYGMTGLPNGFSGETGEVIRLENRIGTQTDRGFRLYLQPKDESQNHIDFSPFFNNPEYRHTIRVKFYIETPSGVTYRDVSGFNFNTYPDVGLRWSFGSNASDAAHGDNITRLNTSDYPLNQWNTLVIDNQHLSGQSTGSIGTFKFAAEYVMPGTISDGTYASLSDSQVNLYIAELSWQVNDWDVPLGYTYA